MEEYVSIKIGIQDRAGRSRLEIEGLDFQKAREKVEEYMEYIFRTERFVNVDIESRSRDGTSLVTRSFERIGYHEIVDSVVEFLRFIYKIGPSHEPSGQSLSKIGPEYISTWLSRYDIENMSQKDKVLHLLKNNHPDGWVRSQDLQEEYEIIYGEKIKLSSLSTYLSRFYSRGILERKGSRAQREYKVSEMAMV